MGEHVMNELKQLVAVYDEKKAVCYDKERDNDVSYSLAYSFLCDAAVLFLSASNICGSQRQL
jgi:hypothetical protein